MVLEELFKHFNYVSYKRLEGVGIFDSKTSDNVKFFYGKKETLFSDGEVVSDQLGICEVNKPSYCISAINYDTQVCFDPRETKFEVFIANEEQETIDKASKKLRELTYEVHRREKKFNKG